MSAAHFWSACRATKSRPSSLGATGSSCFESVVGMNFLFLQAQMALSRMSRATRLSEHTSPRSRSSLCTRGLP